MFKMRKFRKCGLTAAVLALSLVSGLCYTDVAFASSAETAENTAAASTSADTGSETASSSAETAGSTTVSTSSAEDDNVNFALVMDVSGGMKNSDRNDYSRSALLMFADMLPMESADAGIVSFGHSNASDAYDFSDELSPSIEGHKKYVHTVCSMTDLSDENAKKTLKNAIEDMKWNGDQTLIDAGLLGGVDMLAASGTEPDKGCVILLTDGEYMNYTEVGRDDKTDLATALDKVNEEGWSVYCIELDYANSESAKDSAHEYLTGSITNKCNGETYQVASAEDVAGAFMDIIDNFYSSGTKDQFTTDSDGVGTYEIEIPALTSEANIAISSSSIKGIELSNGQTKAVIGDFDGDGTTETDYDANKFVVNTGKIYDNIKMIVPTSGTWTLKVRANSGSDVTVNNISFSTLNMDTTITPAENTEDTALTKADSISAKVQLSYNGQAISSDSMGDAQAYIHVTNETTGDVTRDSVMTWNEQSSCFEGSLQVADLGKAGQLSVWTEVDYAGSRSIESSPVTIYTKNQPVTLIDGASIEDLKGYVGTTLDPISTAELFENPDNDALSFKFEKTSGEDSDAEITLNDDRSAILVRTGTIPGTFEGTLKVWDADMGEEGALSIPMTLTVENHPVQMKQIGDLDMAKDGITGTQINLDDYFSDEDHETLEYAVSIPSSNDCLSLKADGSLLTLDSLKSGSTEVTVSVMDDDGTEYSQTFKVVCATAEDISNAEKTAQIQKIALVVIVILILLLLFAVYLTLKKLNSKLTGTWHVEIKTPESSYSCFLYTDGGDVAMKDRRKATLWDILDPVSFPAGEDAQKAKAALLPERDLLKQVHVDGLCKAEGAKLKASGSGLSMKVGGHETKSGEMKKNRPAEIQLAAKAGQIIVTLEV